MPTTRIQSERKTSKTSDSSKKTGAKRKAERANEKWEELLSRPESDSLLDLLIEDAKKHEQAGRYTDDPW